MSLEKLFLVTVKIIKTIVLWIAKEIIYCLFVWENSMTETIKIISQLINNNSFFSKLGFGS